MCEHIQSNRDRYDSFSVKSIHFSKSNEHIKCRVYEKSMYFFRYYSHKNTPFYIMISVFFDMHIESMFYKINAKYQNSLTNSKEKKFPTAFAMFSLTLIKWFNICPYVQFYCTSYFSFIYYAQCAPQRPFIGY